MFLLSRFQKLKHNCGSEQVIDIALTWRSPNEWHKTWSYRNWFVVWLVVLPRLHVAR
jgi:hypothetical protein